MPNFGEMPMERPTVKDSPKWISDKELDDARISKGAQAEGSFNYIDLVDNLSVTKDELSRTTGLGNRKELQDRVKVLEAYIRRHPFTLAQGSEEDRNYEKGMSFNQLQWDFIAGLGADSKALVHHDVREYLATKLKVEAYRDMKVSQFGKFHLPEEFDDMTIGEAFEKIFPRSPKETQPSE